MSNHFVTLYTYGGGMRGLIPARIMAAIEEKTGLHMVDMVDMFTGPSTGSILNAALTRPHRRNPTKPQYKAKNMVRFYEREGANIFPQDRFREFRGLLHDFNNRTMKISTLSRLMRHGHYNERALSNALYALFGDAKLGDSLKSLVIPCYSLGGEHLDIATEKDGTVLTKGSNVFDKGGEAVWLKHLESPATNPENHKTVDVTLYDAVMASCAAPTYFPCHDFSAFDPNTNQWRNVHAIDGSIFDNPCVSYHGVVKSHMPVGATPVMLCMGTGIANRPIHKDQWNSYGSLGVVDPVNDLPLINIFFNASESALMEAFGNDLGRNLFMFNRSLYASEEKQDRPSVDIDDATPENYARMARFAQILVEENQKKFDDMCHLLVSNRDRMVNEKTDLLSSLKRTVHALTAPAKSKETPLS